MSFIDELKKEIHREAPEEPAPIHPRLNEERFRSFLQEELSRLQAEVRAAAQAGNYTSAGEKHIFEGTRLWHEGDYRHGTSSLASFYPFLSRDVILEKEILTQRKKLLFGYRYEVRFSLTEEGAAYYQLFTEGLLKEGIVVTSLFVKDEQGKTFSLPYTASGSTKYDFELEHYLNNYPTLYYSYRIEI